MDRIRQFLIIPVTLILICSLIISGCVEVTPPSGTQNASSYGPVGKGGNLTSNLERQTPGDNELGPNQTILPSSSETKSSNTPVTGPEEKIPSPPNQTIVQVTPRSLEGLPSAQTTQSYSALVNTAAIGPQEEFVTIYEINHSFVNDAIAYKYDLENPPLYLDLQFQPEMGVDVISYQKRTGDKEGQIDVSVTRPLKDSWFEIRVYNQVTGSEVLREGYGKIYSQSNKTATLRSSGSYQLDMVGNQMNATVKFKVPRNIAVLSGYQNITDMISEKKIDEGKIKGIYLLTSDLPDGWEVAGNVIRTETQYQSTYKKDYITFRQKIQKFDSTETAMAELEKVKKSEGSGLSPTLVGQSGIQEESTSKSEVIFVQGLYLIELNSYSVPDHLSLTDLQNYGKIIVSRINSG